MFVLSLSFFNYFFVANATSSLLFLTLPVLASFNFALIPTILFVVLGFLFMHACSLFLLSFFHLFLFSISFFFLQFNSLFNFYSLSKVVGLSGSTRFEFFFLYLNNLICRQVVVNCGFSSMFHNLKSYTLAIFLRRNYVYILIKNQVIFPLIFFLKNSSMFTYHSLLDICVVDYPARAMRFEILYALLSVINNTRLFLKFCISDIIAVNSITAIFANADWLERECWDLFGVFFINHPNLRRILTDYGFHGHPLRKDFPLTGYFEIRFDDERYSIVYEPLEITQEFRVFSFKNPWERSFS